MKDLHLEIALSFFAIGCTICLQSFFGLFSASTTELLFKTGAEIGLLGILAGIVDVVWHKMT